MFVEVMINRLLSKVNIILNIYEFFSFTLNSIYTFKKYVLSLNGILKVLDVS